MTISIVSGQQWHEDVERLLRDLPEWFGIEASIRRYVEDVKPLQVDPKRFGASLIRYAPRDP